LIRLVEVGKLLASGNRLSFSVKLQSDILIDPAQAATLDYVIREIVTNAYRYAHPEGTPVEITMSCARGPEGTILLDVGDDGVGLPPGFDEWRDAGAGIVSMRAKLEKIGAALTITSDDLGLRFQIELPAKTRPGRDLQAWVRRGTQLPR